MLAVGLALASSLVWGVSDFVGGIVSRRVAVLTLVVLVQLTGLIGALVIAVAVGGEVALRGALLALAAGACGAVSVAAFYSAMASGLISVASPLLASGSVIAFGLAVASGERPSALALAGSALAVAGAVLTSLEGRGSDGEGRGAVAFAIVAAVAFGCALFLLGRASNDTGSAVAVVFQRLGSIVLLGVAAAKVRPTLRVERRWLLAIVGIGLGTAVALTLYGLAATRGMLSTVAILSSTYPVVTVLLAHAFLGERLRRHQISGIAVGLVGIGVLAAGR